MKIEAIDLLINGKRAHIKNGLSRKELIDILGKPDDIGCVTKKCKNGQILVYDTYEFHFVGGTLDSKLWLIYKEDGLGLVETSIRFV